MTDGSLRADKGQQLTRSTQSTYLCSLLSASGYLSMPMEDGSTISSTEYRGGEGGTAEARICIKITIFHIYLVVFELSSKLKFY